MIPFIVVVGALAIVGVWIYLVRASRSQPWAKSGPLLRLEARGILGRSKWIEVAGPCLTGDCNCIEVLDGDPDVIGYPPFHDGCSCVVVDSTEP